MSFVTKDCFSEISERDLDETRKGMNRFVTRSIHQASLVRGDADLRKATPR